MLQNIILRMRVKLMFESLALFILFLVAGWISAYFLGDSSFPAFICKVMAGLMILLVCLLLVEPFMGSSRSRQ